MYRGKCSLNILFYQWLILLEKTDQRSGGILTGRQVLFNKAIYRANGSMFPDHIDSSSPCNKRLWTHLTHTFTHTHREPWIYPLVQGHWVSELLCLGGWIKDCIIFFPNHEKRATLREPQVKPLWLICARKILLNKILTEHWRVSSRSKRKAWNDIKKGRHSVREAHIYLFVLLARMPG